MFYRKIELCIVRMGDNDMRTACTLEQEMVGHVILELHIKEASLYNQGTFGQRIHRALF